MHNNLNTFLFLLNRRSVSIPGIFESSTATYAFLCSCQTINKRIIAIMHTFHQREKIWGIHDLSWSHMIPFVRWHSRSSEFAAMYLLVKIVACKNKKKWSNF